MSSSDHPSRRAIAVALVAAIVASLGDLGLLWVGHSATHPALGIGTPPAGTLAVSQWLGVFSIPLYGLGYWSLAHGLRGRARPIVAWLGLYLAALGATIHAVTGLAILRGQSRIVETSGTFSIPPAFLPYLLPFVLVVVVGLLIASGVFAAAILRGHSSYPRWFAFLNPLVCVLLVALVGAPSDYGRAFLIPMAPNLGSILFFAFGVLAVRGELREQPMRE